MTPAIPVSQHGEFWFPDGSIVLRAEHVLFKVHLSFLARHSTFFKHTLESRTPSDESNGEGSSAAPSLEVCFPPEAFANLLRVIYGPRSEAAIAAMTPGELIALICVAHGLQFREALERTVWLARDRLSTVERLAVALDCGIEEWAYDAFRELVLGFDRGLTDLGARVSHQTHANILIARERVSVARSLFLFRLPPTEQTDHGLYGYAAHVIPTTQRARFQEAYLALDPDALHSADWKPFPQEAFEALAPTPAQEEEIVLDVWRTLQKGPGPPVPPPQAADD